MSRWPSRPSPTRFGVGPELPGNRWMFRVGQADEHPIRLHPRLLGRESAASLFPILVERTPVRLDLSHSGWSDIFFLGMDYPEGAEC